MTVTVIRVIKYQGNEADVRNAMRLSKTLGEHQCNGYIMTIAEHSSDLPKQIVIPDLEVQAAFLADAVEARAKEIYESWSHLIGYVPWVTGGNSTQQDNARRLAYSELSKQ